MYIVSKCLLGYDCKYNGGNNKNDNVIEFCKTHDYVTICPEMDGGLESPRPPAEIVKGTDGVVRVINTAGTDVTIQVTSGAENSLNTVMKELASRGNTARIEGAILKANSPSCGYGTVYDGTFTHTKVKGSGIFTEALLKAFDAHNSFAEYFKIVDENGISELVNK